MTSNGAVAFAANSVAGWDRKLKRDCTVAIEHLVSGDPLWAAFREVRERSLDATNRVEFEGMVVTDASKAAAK